MLLKKISFRSFLHNESKVLLLKENRFPFLLDTNTEHGQTDAAIFTLTHVKDIFAISFLYQHNFQFLMRNMVEKQKNIHLTENSKHLLGEAEKLTVFHLGKERRSFTSRYSTSPRRHPLVKLCILRVTRTMLSISKQS